MTAVKSILTIFFLTALLFSQWDKYPTFPGYVDIMKQFETDYPDLCKIVEFGKSVEGRELFCARISDNVGIKEAEPAFLYSAAIHGDETAGYMSMLHLIDYLLSNYGTDARVTGLVDSVEIWINPLFNPDGMYGTKPSGANANGVDLDRNFPGPGAGPHPDGNEWQPETIAMMALADSNDFVMSANFHGGAEVVAYPFDAWTSDEHSHVDKEWWEVICRDYADTVHNHCASGYMSQMNDGVTNGGDWYVTHGSRMDYMNYFARCREITIEISNTKLLPESQLLTIWEYNYRSLLQYIEQVLYGIRGSVTDSLTGEAIRAKVFVENHDADSSWVYSHLPHGDYYRPIAEGTYSLTFSADGYLPKTVPDVTVENNAATVVNVTLAKDPSSISTINAMTPPFTLCTVNGMVTLYIRDSFNGELRFCLFDIAGRKIKEVRAVTGGNTVVLVDRRKRLSNGVYIARVYLGDQVPIKPFMITR